MLAVTWLEIAKHGRINVFQATTWGEKGFFFPGFLKVDSTDGNLSTIPLASTSHLASPSLSKVPDL